MASIAAWRRQASRHLRRLARWPAIVALLILTTLATPVAWADHAGGPYEGHLLRRSDGRVYRVEGGQRRCISSLAAFQRHGYRWDDVRQVDDSVIDAIPEGRPVRLGQLVKGSGPDIFLLEDGRQRWIPSLEILVGLGFEMADVQPIADAVLAGYPPGPPLYLGPLIRATELEQAVRLLEAEPALAHIAAPLRTYQVPIDFGPLPAGAAASFHLRRNEITVSDRYRSSDPRALAAVLAHEATHAAQYWRRPEPTIGGIKCYAWELEAFEAEITVWTTFFGSNGKPSPSDELERGLNALARFFHQDQDGFRRALRAAYAENCG
jgi:hypothetical protein